VLTARGADLLPRLLDALGAAERLFAQPVFDPATSTRTFRVSTTDYGGTVVLICRFRQGSTTATLSKRGLRASFAGIIPCSPAETVRAAYRPCGLPPYLGS
jgi:hypothetical protein